MLMVLVRDARLAIPYTSAKQAEFGDAEDSSSSPKLTLVFLVQVLSRG